MYMSVQQAAARWGISDRRVRLLCAQGRIPGVLREGRAYLIPSDALKPADERSLRGKQIPEQYAGLFARVDALKAELDRRRPLSQGELSRLQEEFLVSYTYNSTAIEGNTLSLQETALALEGLTISQKPLKDHLEAVGHRDAFLYVLDLVKRKAAISESMLLDIHSLVLMDRPEDKGRYRRVPVRILGVAHQPPKPWLVPEKMEQLLAGLRTEKCHLIEKAARFHLEFEGIHPFIDGNGRTGRLLLNLMLLQAGYPAIDVKFTDRQAYYACFESYQQDGSPDLMVNMVANYLMERMEGYLQILRPDAL